MSNGVVESAVDDHKPEAIAAGQLRLSSFLLDLRAGELLTSDGQLRSSANRRSMSCGSWVPTQGALWVKTS